MSKKKLIEVPQSISYLDLVFETISKKPMKDGHIMTAESLINYFNLSSIRFSEKQMLSILDKLQSDGLIVAKHNSRALETISIDTDIEITFQGVLFRDTIKSYQQKYLAESVENNRLASLEKNQKFHRFALTVLTLIIAFGTIVAAFYYAIEVMKYFGWIPQNRC